MLRLSFLEHSRHIYCLKHLEYKTKCICIDKYFNTKKEQAYFYQFQNDYTLQNNLTNFINVFEFNWILANLYKENKSLFQDVVHYNTTAIVRFQKELDHLRSRQVLSKS